MTETGNNPRHPSQQEDEISLLRVVAVFLRQRWLIVGFALAVPALVGTVTLLTPRNWTATTSFMPQASGDQPGSRLASLAGQFGISIGGNDAGQSPEFYARLVRSREILGTLAADSFNLGNPAEPSVDSTRWVTLEKLLDAEGPSSAIRRAAVLRWLQNKAVSTSVGDQTGIVDVSVTTRWPVVSQEIAQSTVRLVNQFNLSTRQSQAAAEGRFIEGRMEEAQGQLRAAENDLQRFLQDNREFANSPELVFEHDRLQRQVNMRQQVYTSLAQSYEQARIDEVRNTPVITVIEEAERPIRPDGRHLITKVILGVILGGLAGILVAFGRDYIRRGRDEDAEDFEEVAYLWQEAKTDMKRITKRFRASK